MLSTHLGGFNQEQIFLWDSTEFKDRNVIIKGGLTTSVSFLLDGRTAPRTVAMDAFR